MCTWRLGSWIEMNTSERQGVGVRAAVVVMLLSREPPPFHFVTHLGPASYIPRTAKLG